MILCSGKGRQAKTNGTEGRDIILYNKRQIILQIDFDLRTQVGALDEISEIFQREFTLDNLARVLLQHKAHASIGLGAVDFCACELAGTFEDELVANRLNLQLVRNARQVTNNLLKIRRRQVDDRGKLDVGIFQLVQLGLNET